MASLNRFLEGPRREPAYSRLQSRSNPRAWVVPQAADVRELVVLLENGGIDLGLQGFVDAVVAVLPGASLVVSEEMRGAMAAQLREWVKQSTDGVLEDAELALNRYSSAHPGTYGAVHVLRNSTATYTELRDRLFAATRAGHVVDVLILTHGSDGFIATQSGIDAARIRGLRTEFGGPLNIRSVYMMSCVGASLNQAWLQAGARTSAGTTGNNNLPEPTTHFFWTGWKEGQAFQTAVTSAYSRTVEALNAALRGIITALVPVAGDTLATHVDVSTLEVIASSRPEVAGDGTLTIASDALPAAPTTSTGNALVTTVLPMHALAKLRARATAYAMTTGRALSPSGRTFVESWERPLLAPGPDAEAGMASRIAAAEHEVSERIAQPLTQEQLDAVICFACGIGKPAFLRSTVLRLLNDGMMAQVPVEMMKWTKVRRAEAVVHSDALAARRRAEAELFTNPRAAMVVPASREVQAYAYQQNPVAAVGLVEAIDWGLAAGGLAQSAGQAISGGFSLTFDKAQRLLTPEARLAMPGARAATVAYSRTFLTFPQIRIGTANAVLAVDWGGNAYGEMESIVFKKVLGESSAWSKSELRVTVTLLGKVPTGTDPRAWPFSYRYEGRYDPFGNGEFEFEGEIEVDAFGGIRWSKPHNVVSHSLADFAISGSPDDWVQRGPDVVSTVPSIPAEQQAYLRQHLPA